jgi:pimeloyl-ACP methyl ester carboxylesterase
MHIATCVWQEKAAPAGGMGGARVAGGGGGGEWGARAAAAAALGVAGRALNCAVSFVVFSALDVLDVVLCLAYKLADYAAEAEWRPCYCSAAADPRVAQQLPPKPKVVRLSAASPARLHLQLEDVSDTLYARPSLLADATRAGGDGVAPALTVSPAAIAALIREKTDRAPRQAPCWSDCDCKVCHAWSGTSPASLSHLYVHVQAPPAMPMAVETEDVVFIHGFISSSAFWTETVFPAFSPAARSRYRMFAVDLLGFGRSPKPAESLYTLREHVEMIERSVLRRYRLGSFHVVAHSLGSVLALALAVKYPAAVKSLTLLAPPYFPVPESEAESAAQYVMRRVAPRRVWPPIAFGASVACWYEHVSRTICLAICRHHRVWDRLFRIVTRNRYVRVRVTSRVARACLRFAARKNTHTACTHHENSWLLSCRGGAGCARS